MTRTHARSGFDLGRRALTAAATLAITACAASGLAGCTAPAPTPATLDSATATERYQPVVDDLTAALTEAFPAVTWTDNSETRVTDGGDGAGDSGDGDDGAGAGDGAGGDGADCSLAIGAKRGDPSLPTTAGSWAEVIAVVNPVLTSHDFAEIADEDSLEGGWTGIRSTDDGGAELRFADKSYTLLTLSVGVTDIDC